MLQAFFYGIYNLEMYFDYFFLNTTNISLDEIFQNLYLN
jgi:hypothetical protein